VPRAGAGIAWPGELSGISSKPHGHVVIETGERDSSTCFAIAVALNYQAGSSATPCRRASSIPEGVRRGSGERGGVPGATIASYPQCNLALDMESSRIPDQAPALAILAL